MITNITTTSDFELYLSQIEHTFGKDAKRTVYAAFLKASKQFGDTVAAQKIQKAVNHNCFSDLEKYINS